MRSASTFTLGSLIVLFFLWGLLTSLNDILVPHLKAAFDLQHWQAQLIQFFFFGAYFVMSIPAGVIIRKIGYKGGIVLGLILMGVGCAVFYPASIVKIYAVFLLGLFILASGITILQVAANPYVAVIGPPETAASRLNLAQGFNSLGHTIAPLFGAWLILQNTEIVEVESVQMPYLFLAGALVLIGLVFLRLQLPPIAYEEPDRRGFQLKNYPHLYLGAIAIFCYVGAEIAVGSFLVEYFKAEPTIGLDNKTAGSYVAFYWGGAMVGRFLGAIALGKEQTARQRAWKMLPVPVLAVLIVGALVGSLGLPMTVLYGVGALLLLNYLAFWLGRATPQHMLTLFAFINMILLFVTMLGSGSVALWSVLGIGLFNSIMWSNIFTLSIKDLKQYTSYGSSLLVMMIVGGAIIPIAQGLLADVPGVGVKWSFLVPAAAYFYLIVYGRSGYQVRSAGYH
jgi:FHS family L-fucose permease-like MFS transporter